MATKVWSGFLRLAMLTVPVYLNVGARGESTTLNTFHSCGSRIKMPKYCPACERMADESEITKGYDLGKGAGFVPISKDEIESIEPESAKVMEITEFVPWEEVDPIYLAESFYILPDDAGIKPYGLLVDALKQSGRVAIAQLTKNSREHIVLIRPKDNGLMAHFLFYPNEVHRVSEFESLSAVRISADEQKLALKLVDNFAADFEPSQFENGYDQRLNALIASKMDSKKPAPVPVKAAKLSATNDLASTLAASLAVQKKPRRAISVNDEVEAPRPALKKSAVKSKKGRAA